MDQFLGKKYVLKSSENLDEFLKFCEISFLARKAAASLTPTTVLTKEDDGTYTLTVITSFRTIKTSFKPGEEFIEERVDGVKLRTTITFDGTDMIQVQIEENGRKSTHVRKYTAETMTLISTAEGWDGQCIRVYEATN